MICSIGLLTRKEHSIFFIKGFVAASLLMLAAGQMAPPADTHPHPLPKTNLLRVQEFDTLHAVTILKSRHAHNHQKQSTAASKAVKPLLDGGVESTPEQAAITTPFVELGAMDSRPGEGLEIFLMRVAQVMDMFTRKTKQETCGVIMAKDDNNGFRVRMTTNRAHIACVGIVFEEPGFHRLGPDIHTHPHVPGGIIVNAQDSRIRPDFICGERVLIFDEKFSDIDLKHGSGYLVSRTRLLYQHGTVASVREVGVFDSIDTMPTLMLGGGPSVEAGIVGTAAVRAAWADRDTVDVPTTKCPPRLTPRRRHRMLTN